jgi:hypothetical protein
MLKHLSRSNRFDVVIGEGADAATFTFRTLSCDEYGALAELQSKAKDARQLCELIAVPLVDWQNVVVDDPEIAERLRQKGVKVDTDAAGRMTIPYQPAALVHLLGLEDAGELMNRAVEGMRPGEKQLGKSTSPAPSQQA